MKKIFTSDEKTKFSKILQNFTFLALGKTLGDIFTFILFVSLSREFGTVGIGQYSFAMGLTGFCVVLADFGLYEFTVKKLSRNRELFDNEYFCILMLRLFLSFVVFACLVVVVYLSSASNDMKMIIVIIGLYQILYTVLEGIGTIFLSYEDMHIVGILELSTKFLIAIIGVILIYLGVGLITVLAMYPLITTIQICLSYKIVLKKYGMFIRVLDVQLIKDDLKGSFPYFISLINNQLSTRMDVIFLGFILTAGAVGIYNASYRIVFIFMVLAHFFGISLLPQSTQLFCGANEKLKKLTNDSLNTVLLFCIPAAAGIWLLSPQIIDTIYGPEFAESTQVLRYLSIIIFLVFPEKILGFLLISSDKQMLRAKFQWAAVVIYLIGNLILIYFMGVKGAAIATVISEISLVALYTYALQTLISLEIIFKRILVVSFSTFVFCMVIMLLKIESIVLSIVVGIGLYISVLMLFKSFRDDELQSIKNYLYSCRKKR